MCNDDDCVMLLCLLLAGVVSWSLTGLIRRYALARSLLDIPNKRSSHTVPTPRGGGMAIVLTFVVSLLIFAGMGRPEMPILSSLLGAGVLVALVGFIDDHQHIAARWRLLMHVIAAAWALFWLGGFPPLPVYKLMLDLGWLGHGLAVVYLVWLLNLYNFMDGIDGIAGIEAVTVCLGSTVLYALSPVSNSELILLPMLLCVSVVGFLFWNFPRAKIFMGDVGSGFIGIVLGVLSIQAAWVSPELFWGWVILLGAFVVDATVTLLRRMIRGLKISVAHRSHAYQYTSRILNTHSMISIVYAMINLIWLLPIAALVVRGWVDGALGVFIAYLPLVLLAIRFKAGANELQEI